MTHPCPFTLQSVQSYGHPDEQPDGYAPGTPDAHRHDKTYIHMFITVANDKGGANKTTAAVYIAAYFQKPGATLLIDKDPNGGERVWGHKGKLPFTIMNWEDGTYHARSFKRHSIRTRSSRRFQRLRAPRTNTKC